MKCYVLHLLTEVIFLGESEKRLVVLQVMRDTSDILIEVTSSTSLDTCKKVMQELLQRLLEMGIGTEGESPDGGMPPVEDEDDDEAEMLGAVGGEGDEGLVLKQDQVLVVQQVKVVDGAGSLKVLYPSRVDLQGEGFRVMRD